MLPYQAYEKKAQQVLDATLKLQKGLPHDLKDYCEKRKLDFQKLNENRLDSKKSMQILDPEFFKLFALNFLEIDSGARFGFEFAKASQQLATYHVRKILKCYTASLEDFEMLYSHEMTQVTIDEFKAKADALDPKLEESILIEEAAKLATKFLEDKAHL